MIAVIGIVGAIAVAVISNLDKFGDDNPVATIPIDKIVSQPSMRQSVEISESSKDIYIPKQFDGRIGKIFVKNTTSHPFKVTLWHPDSELIYRSWVLDGTTKLYLKINKEAINIGNDWGIQIGDSEVKSIDVAATWTNNEWRVAPNSFF